MNGKTLTTPSDAITFKLGVLGAVVTERFADDIAEHGLKPKHVGVLIALASGSAASQSELAHQLNVAASLVVALADDLQELGAIERIRDSRDRRRQVLSITDEGRRLLEVCAHLAKRLDDDLTDGWSRTDRNLLERSLSRLAEEEGLPH